MRRNLPKRNFLVWRHRILVALFTAVCIVVVGWVWHPLKSTDQAKLAPLVTETSSLTQPPRKVGLDVSGVKTAIRAQVEAFKKEIAQFDQQDVTFSIPKEFQGKIIAETTLPLKEKVIALTFDDGPWPRTTEQVLDILAQNDIKATLLLIGNNLRKFP